ncbi:MAG: ATP-binding cassette, subfamily bacterial [Actinomycetota bacterium]|jgi:ABC-type multidrug transport system fused ATPase/permease subunit
MSERIDQWRGVASDDSEEVTASLSVLLRRRSRRLLGSLLRPYRQGLLWALVLIVVENACALAAPYLVRVGIDRGIPPLQRGGSGALQPLVTVGVALTVAALVQAATYDAFMRTTGRVGQSVLLDLRQRLFDHFQKLSLAFHERYTSGRVISRQTSDVEAIAELVTTGVDTVVTAVLSVGTIAVILLVLDLPLGLAVLLVFPLVVALTAWFRRHSERAYRATREAVALVIVHFVESLGGIRAVHAFRREPRNQEIFDDVNDRYRAANVHSARLAGVYGPGVRGLGHLTTVVVLLYGGSRVVDGQMTLGVLAAYLLYLRRFFEPLQELSQFYNLFQAAAAGLEKISGILAEDPSVPEPERPVALLSPRGDVRLDRVSFGYRPGAPVLNDFSLHIPAGQTLALVGLTGAGKSTVARLIARFYDPRAGRVTLDDVDVRDLPDDVLRRTVAMVTQEGFLFSGTVADNIALGRPDASRDEVEAAARAIGAHEFIAALPAGYDSDVRKRGGRLSSGQRQLVAFARAFLADPQVLILDEATSSLDIPSERLVQRALRSLLADRTAVIIAHRLSTVEIADRVVVIDDGSIIEDGAPDELRLGHGEYARLQQAWQDSLI